MKQRFRLGINYWPASSAMGFWRAFEPAEVAADFQRMAASGFDSVRLFLTWEDFQPSSDGVDSRAIERLLTTLSLASDAKLGVMPTLFTGHMSGVNFIPAWALGGSAGDARFRVVSGGTVVPARLCNWYTDWSVLMAQAALAAVLSRACAGHAALWAWDLGNESSNCVVSPNRASARSWLARMADAIRSGDPTVPITVGLHMEDLAEDRKLGPAEAAEVCDFLTMHGYPGYAPWAAGPTDVRLLPFLARLTRWLGGGKDVVFSELGVPTYRDENHAAHPQLVDEMAAARYVARSLEALADCGCSGAMLWCARDYVSDLWEVPPFDLAVHERSFGLWRADGSAKPAVAAVEEFAKLRTAPKAESRACPEDSAWIDIEPHELHRPPGTELARLYRRFCEALLKLE